MEVHFSCPDHLNILSPAYEDGQDHFNRPEIRIYTWNLPLRDGTNTYFGFLQYKTNNKAKSSRYS